MSIVLGAAVAAAYFAVRATSWAVMTDELQVVRLSESIAQRLSPVPYIHGVYYAALSQLYPLLIAPFFGLMSAPTAERAAHAFNAVLVPSAAFPAFLLARSVTGSRAAGVSAAALTAFTPWLVLTSTLLTENAAYPAFLWAMLLCHRALVAPSVRRDVGALAGLGLAFFARTQLLALAAVLPVAVVLHELGRAGGGSRTAGVGLTLRRSVFAHPVLAAAYAVASLGATVLAFMGSLGAAVGNYAVPFSGDLFPPGLWQSAAAHLDHVVIGCAVLPFVLATGWAATNVIRPERREANAFAVLLLLLVPLLTVEVASFDLRFTPGGFNQDRYLFYLAPLFAVGSAAALIDRGAWRVRAVSYIAAFGLFAWLLTFAAYDDRVIFWAAPAAAFHSVLVSAGSPLHLGAEAFVAIAAFVLGVGVVVLNARMPRAALGVATAGVASFGLAQAVYVFDRYADHVMTRPPKAGSAPPDWIDKAVPEGNAVALVPSPHDNPEYWWEAELWNKKVDRVLRVNGGRTFSPFPANDVRVRFGTGILAGSEPREYLVTSPSETRFHLLETARIYDAGPLWLVRVERPYRLDWATRGVSADGWTFPDRRATLRFYGHGEPGGRTIEIVLSSSAQAGLPLSFTFRAAGAVRRGRVDPGGARPAIALSLCVPAHGSVDATLRAHGSVRIPDGRLVALHVDRITATRSGGACRTG